MGFTCSESILVAHTVNKIGDDDIDDVSVTASLSIVVCHTDYFGFFPKIRWQQRLQINLNTIIRRKLAGFRLLSMPCSIHDPVFVSLNRRLYLLFS